MPIQKPTSPVKATTQQFIEIEEIQDDVVLLKDYSAVLVIEISAVNFWLLSSEEQMSIIYAYGSLLNSLSFPLQILILSKKMDISNYLDYLDQRIEKTNDEILKTRLKSYKEFIKNIVKKNTVLEKRFFFVIPFSPLELGISGVNTSYLKKDYVLSRAKTSLYPKRDHLLRLLAKIGLSGKVLQKQELTELFYNLYNPSPTGRPLAPVESYTDVVLVST
jgi:type IV secretory pathway VirB4 component